MDCCGQFWSVGGCCELLWTVVGYCGLIWAALSCCGLFISPFTSLSLLYLTLPLSLSLSLSLSFSDALPSNHFSYPHLFHCLNSLYLSSFSDLYSLYPPLSNDPYLKTELFYAELKRKSLEKKNKNYSGW